MTFLDQACDAAPLYFVGGSLCVLAMLMAILIAIILWPMGPKVRLSRDADGFQSGAMAEPFGDQTGFSQGGIIDCSKLPKWRR